MSLCFIYPLGSSYTAPREGCSCVSPLGLPAFTSRKITAYYCFGRGASMCLCVCVSRICLSFSLPQTLPCDLCREQEVASAPRAQGSAPTMSAYTDDSTRFVPALKSVPAAAQAVAGASIKWSEPAETSGLCNCWSVSAACVVLACQ